MQAAARHDAEVFQGGGRLGIGGFFRHVQEAAAAGGLAQQDVQHIHRVGAQHRVLRPVVSVPVGEEIDRVLVGHQRDGVVRRVPHILIDGDGLALFGVALLIPPMEEGVALLLYAVEDRVLPADAHLGDDLFVRRQIVHIGPVVAVVIGVGRAEQHQHKQERQRDSQIDLIRKLSAVSGIHGQEPVFLCKMIGDKWKQFSISRTFIFFHSFLSFFPEYPQTAGRARTNSCWPCRRLCAVHSIRFSIKRQLPSSRPGLLRIGRFPYSLRIGKHI